MGKTKKRGGKNEKTEQERQQNTQKRPKNDENLKKVVCSISHPQLPIDSLQPWSKDSFNFFIFIYLVDALWGQHLYMYKRFWWWEDPRGNHAEGSLNYYLIDHRIPIAILLSLAQPLTTFFVTNGYGALNRLIKDEFKSFHAPKFWLDIFKTISIFILGCWALAFLNLTVAFINERRFIGAFVLTGPLIYKGIRCVWRMNEFRIKIERKYGESFKPTMFQTYMTAGQMLIYQKDMLALGELTEVKNIRHETDFMMRDFRKRIASMFLPAFEAAYYICFIPWYFRPAEMYVEQPWCIVHAILIVFNILIYHSSQEFYPAYLHATYKISTHLGEWEEIGGEIDSDTMSWKDGERYFQGLIVAYKGKRYKAKGKFINAARPGYRHDRIFNKLFGDSFLVYKAMTVFQVVIVCTQLFLMHNAQWDRLVALCLEQFHGYWNLFRIVRNWFTVKRAYSESMPKSHDPFTIIPKLCESVGKEYYKIGLE